MACKEEIHIGDDGLPFRITITNDCATVVDLTDFTTFEIIFRKPDGITVLIKPATIYGDPTNGVIQYVTSLNDLDTAGTWRIQAHIQNATQDLYSNIEKFKVYANL